MKKLFSFLILLCFIFILASCDDMNLDQTTDQITTTDSNNNISSTNEIGSYTITFKNYDGAILQESSVKGGNIPEYNGKTPVKESDSNYSYAFSGWTPTLFTAVGDATYTAIYTKTALNYDITYDLDGGINDLNNPTEYNADMDNIKLLNPTKEDYSFVGWDYNGNIISEINTSNGCNMNLKAKWTYYTLTTSVNNSKGGNVTSYDEAKITNGKEIIIEATPNVGFTFGGWYNGDNEISKEAKYIFNMPKENVIYEARFIPNKYKITIDNNSGVDISGIISGNKYDCGEELVLAPASISDGYSIKWERSDGITYIGNSYKLDVPAADITITTSIVANTDTKYKVEHYLQNIDDDNYPAIPYEVDDLEGTTDTLTNGEVNEYEGFKSPAITQVNIDGDGKTVIKLYYQRNKYYLDVRNNIGGITYTGFGYYKYNAEATILANDVTGYTFVGWWYNGKDELTKDKEYTFNIPAEVGIYYEARYEINKYKIIIDNQADGVTISGIISGNEYDYNSEIILSATNIPAKSTIRWERSDNQAYVGDSYKFNVPTENITVTITIAPLSVYTRENGKIYFGSYPQTLVDEEADAELVLKLNDLASSGTWIDYGYYYEKKVKSFMYYQDIDINSDGTYDYRGVYFTTYRPEYTTSYVTYASNSCQDENGYIINKTYWFEYKPIEWNILKEENGKAFLISNLILDSQAFDPLKTSTNPAFNSSPIRQWLNDAFYNTAFTALEQKIIDTTIVYDLDTKIFFLSSSEVKNEYYQNSTTRVAFGTDYAKCQGLRVTVTPEGYSDWWLRSTDNNRIYGVGQLSSSQAHNTQMGVRPVLWINL